MVIGALICIHATAYQNQTELPLECESGIKQRLENFSNFFTFRLQWLTTTKYFHPEKYAAKIDI